VTNGCVAGPAAIVVTGCGPGPRMRLGIHLGAAGSARLKSPWSRGIRSGAAQTTSMDDPGYAETGQALGRVLTDRAIGVRSSQAQHLAPDQCSMINPENFLERWVASSSFTCSRADEGPLDSHARWTDSSMCPSIDTFTRSELTYQQLVSNLVA